MLSSDVSETKCTLLPPAIFVDYGAAYRAIQQGLSMEKAIQAQRNYNLTKLPPYVPDSSSTAQWTPQADPQVQEETTLQLVVADSIKSAGIVTPPPDYFFRDRGGKQHGDCGPDAAIATIWYIVQQYPNHFRRNYSQQQQPSFGSE